MTTKLTQEHLRSLVDYDAETGEFRWKQRPVNGEHRIGQWNARYAGKIAGDKMKVGYWRLRINETPYFAHRLAWFFVNGRWPIAQIDHIDGDRLNNKFSNLREATPLQNTQNRGAQKNNRLGLKGVRRANRKFRADIKVGQAVIYLGVFGTAQEAHEAYCMAATKHFGEFSGH